MPARLGTARLRCGQGAAPSALWIQIERFAAPIGASTEGLAILALAGWMADWMGDWMADCMTGWMADCMTDWMAEKMAYWMADWMAD